MDNFTKARRVTSDAAQYMSQASYVVLRPSMYIGEYMASGFIAESKEYQIMAGHQEGPARPIAFFDSLGSAMDEIMIIRNNRPQLKIWYDGQEGLSEIKGHPWVGLADVLRQYDDPYTKWDLVYRVATGSVDKGDRRLNESSGYLGSTFKMAIAEAQMVAAKLGSNDGSI